MKIDKKTHKYGLLNTQAICVQDSQGGENINLISKEIQNLMKICLKLGNFDLLLNTYMTIYPTPNVDFFTTEMGTPLIPIIAELFVTVGLKN